MDTFTQRRAMKNEDTLTIHEKDLIDISDEEYNTLVKEQGYELIFG